MIQLNGKVFKYAGPPGTGKSTTLLGVVERYLETGVDPENIVYTTFTRAGAYEARDRACKRFGLSPARLPHFRTLHSLCYQAVGGDVMQNADWCALASQLGIGFSLNFGPDEGVPRGRTKGDGLMALWALARVTRQPIEAVYLARSLYSIGMPELTIEELNHFIQTVQNYKTTFGKVDYTDMLEKWLTEAPAVHSDYVIVDEAQDLSLLQWEVIKKLSLYAKETHVAGDDDQCIHEWNGAAPQLFIELPAAEFKVLPQSFRIPNSVYGLAQTVITQVLQRIPKEYRSREEPGAVERVNDISQVDLSQGSWLLLARNNCFLENYVDHCKQLGFLFTGVNRKQDAKSLLAIEAWNNLRSWQPISGVRAKMLYTFMSQRDRVKRGSKTLLNAEPDDKFFTYEILSKDFGLVAPQEMLWPQALDMMDTEERDYLEAVEKKEGLRSVPRIDISTIHGAKGREADHVLLSPDMTFRTWDAYRNAPDCEHRVWYVGVTRARKSLHILPASTECHYPL